MKEEKQLLLKDICARLPYGVMCHANEINLDGELLFINKVYDIVALYNDKAVGKFDTCSIADVKSYLRPMSSMTEEEWLKLKEWIFVSSDTKGKIYFDGFRNISAEDTIKAIDYLNAHHFDYRGLIEKGLAIEAPEDIYK